MTKKIEKMNVLVVEDERHMRTLFRNVLFALGVHDVAEASDGQSALQELKAFTPDLVLCDLRMSPMGGLEFIRQVRAHPENPNRFVPVILVTAHADLDSVANARDAGVNEFMAKPISALALEKRIRRVLEDQRPFVNADDFVGPDRRRSKKAAFGGNERRETPPTIIEPEAP
ncbi:MAG: response regulator [Rhodospirillales bacterium]|nr:response regulator [Rhodospirillales bacterium]